MMISASPQRSVQNNILTSHAMPNISLRVSNHFAYLGNLKFTVIEVTSIDLFLFAVTEGNDIKRLLTIQFEGYLPDNDYTYDYPVDQTVRLGANQYLADGGVVKLGGARKRRPEGDIAYWTRWLQEQGYDFEKWNEMGYRRFVRVLDRARKNELLILYFENLRYLGFTADGLLKNGSAAAQMPQLMQAMYDRALLSLDVLEG
jgi:hypothetical protein